MSRAEKVLGTIMGKPFHVVEARELDLNIIEGKIVRVRDGKIYKIKVRLTEDGWVIDELVYTGTNLVEQVLESQIVNEDEGSRSQVVWNVGGGS